MVQRPAGLKTFIYAGLLLLKSLKVIELYSKSNKNEYICSAVFAVFSLGLCLIKDTKLNTHSQNEVVLLHYRGVYGVVETNLFLLHKNWSLVLIFLMTCKAIGFPDRFLSSMQPRYETVWYCLICTVPYLILRLISFLIAFLCQTICIWFCLPQNEYLVCYRQTSCKHSKNCC